MHCPQCNKEMSSGYLMLTFVGAGGCGLNWTPIEPSVWKMKKVEGEKNILRADVLHLGKKNWAREAYTCAECGVYVFKAE